MEFTGKAFHVTGLNWEEWMWTIFLGFSSLIWGQLVLTIPKNSFPKLCRFGRSGVPLDPIIEPDGGKDSRARLLWIRGLTRLQHQVCYSLCVTLICFGDHAHDDDSGDYDDADTNDDSDNNII